MKEVRFSVPIFDVDVVLLQVEKPEDKENVLKAFEEFDPTDAIIEEVSETIENDRTNGAATFWNGGLHTGVIVFYRMESNKRTIVCYAHEKRHLEDRILKFCGIDDTETAAYLSGWLAPYFKELAARYNVQ